MPKEVWKPIQGFEDSYEVSSMGHVRTKPHYVQSKHGDRYIPSHEIKPVRNSTGYYKVGLWSKNKNKQVLLDQLVAKHFLPNKDGLPHVNHIDEDKANNSVKNLQWMSAKDNTNYGTCISRRVKSRFTNHGGKYNG